MARRPHRLRPVGIGFLDTAPVTMAVAADPSPAAAVFLRLFRPALRAAFLRAAHRLDRLRAVPPQAGSG